MSYKTLLARMRKGSLMKGYPEGDSEAPDAFTGLPVADKQKCNSCMKCVAACPTGAIEYHKGGEMTLDAGKCIFCSACSISCPAGAMSMGKEYELASLDSSGLLRLPFKDGAVAEMKKEKSGKPEKANASDSVDEKTGEKLRQRVSELFGSSLHVREVDAGSCNGCEIEATCLGNPYYDLERFGISFVASPRHADALFVTGPASRNMQLALEKTYQATPDPKIIIAVGSCAISGGIFRGSYATEPGIGKLVPVFVNIPGCPPRPQAIIHGFLLALDLLSERK